MPVAFGGPYCGFLATREKFVRQMPGRLVGQTSDSEGRRGYVLTLATREQHIRREKATSNICTSQSLMALNATIYLCLLGKTGLRMLAEHNLAKACYAAERLRAVAAAALPFSAPRFNEFVVHAPQAARAWETLAREGVVVGFPLGRWYPELDGTLLLCVTETHAAEQVDRLVAALAASAPAARAAGG